VRSIAFYLPQFHPIPENDEWWGMGFTEWTNAVAARPRFRGHYQPHLPADLGFYDLRVAETRAAQAAMAAEYGIHGFCYYHYWFNGVRLLHRPLDEVLAAGEPDFPFMLCWANESWSRTWEGANTDVLIEQTYDTNDDRVHIRALLTAFADPRYIKVRGCPVFLVYNASALPDPWSTTRIWRAEAQRAGFPDLYLCRVESHAAGRVDPYDVGFDAAVEFMPDVSRLRRPVGPRSRPGKLLRRLIRPDSPFRTNFVFEYDDVVSEALSQLSPPYLRFRCVMPSWDNSARRKHGAFIFRGSTPAKYYGWLRETVMTFEPPSPEEDLVFTNAWNEWAEGNHLEPDQRWGRAYLEAHRCAMGHASRRLRGSCETKR
jgi:lipopolysaccharide biosynthesis protein